MRLSAIIYVKRVYQIGAKDVTDDAGLLIGYKLDSGNVALCKFI